MARCDSAGGDDEVPVELSVVHEPARAGSRLPRNRGFLQVWVSYLYRVRVADLYTPTAGHLIINHE